MQNTIDKIAKEIKASKEYPIKNILRVFDLRNIKPNTQTLIMKYALDYVDKIDINHIEKAMQRAKFNKYDIQNTLDDIKSY